MSLSRWDPFEDMVSLRDAMNQLFEESFIRPRRQATGNGGRVYRVPVDVYETADAYVVEAVVPGIPVDQINIEYENGNLILSGELHPTQHDDATYHLRERWHGAFGRVLSLPGSIDAENIEATVENGVLTVELPKVEEAKPRRIPVTTVN